MQTGTGKLHGRTLGAGSRTPVDLTRIREARALLGIAAAPTQSQPTGGGSGNVVALAPLRRDKLDERPAS